MDIPGIAIVFTYFDSFIGPKPFYVEPELDTEILNLLSSILGLHENDVVFSHTYKDMRIFSENIQISSPKSRGGMINCLFSVCCYNKYQNLIIPNEIIKNFTQKIKNIKSFDTILIDKNSKQFNDLNTRFLESIGDLFEELNKFIEQGKKKLIVYIPGLFTVKNENKDGMLVKWNFLEHNSEYLAQLCDLIENRYYQEAYQDWKKMDTHNITETSNRIRYLLIGCYLKNQNKDFKEAYNLAEQALNILNSESQAIPILYIDSVISIVETAANLGMIMIFESAFNEFDARVGYSTFSIEHYKQYLDYLEKALNYIEILDFNYIGIKFRKALLLHCIGKLKVVWNKVEFQSQRLNEALITLNEGQRLFSSLPVFQYTIENFVVLANLYDLLNQYEIAWEYYRNAENILGKISTSEQTLYRAWIFQQKGWNYFHHGFIDEAIQLFTNSIDELSKASDLSNKANYHAVSEMRLAYIYLQKNNLNPLVLNILLNAKQIFEEIHNNMELARTCYLIGDAYKNRGEIDSALNYYEECGMIADKENDAECLGISYVRRAKLAFENQELALSLSLYNQALPFFEKINHPQFLGIAYGEIGAIYQINNETQLALEYYTKSLNSFNKESNEFQSFWTYYKLVSLLVDSDFENAFRFAEKLTDLNNRSTNSMIYQIKRITDALIKSHNNNSRDQLKAEFLLEQVAYEKSSSPKITFAAFYHLSCLIIKQFIITDLENPIEELINHLENMQKQALELNLIKELIIIAILNAKLALIHLNFVKYEEIIDLTLKSIVNFGIKKMKDRLILLQKIDQKTRLIDKTIQDRMKILNIESDFKEFKDEISYNLLIF